MRLEKKFSPFIANNFCPPTVLAVANQAFTVGTPVRRFSMELAMNVVRSQENPMIKCPRENDHFAEFNSALFLTLILSQSEWILGEGEMCYGSRVGYSPENSEEPAFSIHCLRSRDLNAPPKIPFEFPFEFQHICRSNFWSGKVIALPVRRS